MIKNYVFDLGRVLFDYSPEYMTKQYVSDPDDCRLLEKAVFDRRYWDLLDRDEISDEALKAAVKSEIPQRLHATADKIYDNWIENLTPIEGMKEIVQTVKDSNAGLYLLSNISVGFSKKWKRIPRLYSVLSLFDGLVMSGTLHLAKPDERIFKYLTDTYSLCAEECLFVDDNEGNIAAAKRLGFMTYHFDGDAEGLKKFIENEINKA